ncbi:MAG: hypothetical protein HFJ94_00810 [Muribaculaceae bacterium]|nr:hypothetical protein [Muribaculaceae bacterium]
MAYIIDIITQRHITHTRTQHLELINLAYLIYLWQHTGERLMKISVTVIYTYKFFRQILFLAPIGFDPVDRPFTTFSDIKQQAPGLARRNKFFLAEGIFLSDLVSHGTINNWFAKYYPRRQTSRSA